MKNEADDNPSLPSPSPVCPLHKSPCVRPKRLRVCRHHAHMCFNMCAWCRYTRGRIERRHGDVLSGHTGFFSAPHHTTHRTHNTRHNTTWHTTTHHSNTSATTHGDRDMQRQRKRETEKTEKTRQQKRQERRFIFSLVVHGRSLFMECVVLLNPSTPDSSAC